MFTSHFFYLIVTLCQLAVLYAYIYWADKFQIVDKPNHRSSHYRPTVRGGGIIFPLTMIFAFAINGFEYPWVLAGLVAVSVVSFWDDISPLSYSSRIVVHIIAAFLLVANLQLEWYWYVLIPFCVVAFINAANFMDGINGITAIFGLVVLLSALYVNSYITPFIQSSYLILLGTAILVFSYFNFRIKARCFAGDVGSVSLAFIIGFLVVSMVVVSGNFMYVAFVMVYAVDSSVTIMYRIKNRENLTQPHRSHLYQLMANERKIPHLVVSSIYGVVQLAVSSVVIMLLPFSQSVIMQLVVVGSLYLFLSLFYVWLRYVIKVSQNAGEA